MLRQIKFSICFLSLLITAQLYADDLKSIVYVSVEKGNEETNDGSFFNCKDSGSETLYSGKPLVKSIENLK